MDGGPLAETVTDGTGKPDGGGGSEPIAPWRRRRCTYRVLCGHRRGSPDGRCRRDACRIRLSATGRVLPGTFLLVGILYLLFSVGFTTMSRFTGSAGGASYPYIAAGLGRPARCRRRPDRARDIQCHRCRGLRACLATSAATSSNRLGGPDMAWWVYAFCSRRCCLSVWRAATLPSAARCSGFCMIAEIVILLILGIAILASGGGPESVSLAPFGPQAIFAKGFRRRPGLRGLCPSSALRRQRSSAKRRMIRAVPSRGQHTSPVSLIAVFYAFATWTITLSLWSVPGILDEAGAAYHDALYKCGCASIAWAGRLRWS